MCVLVTMLARGIQRLAIESMNNVRIPHLFQYTHPKTHTHTHTDQIRSPTSIRPNDPLPTHALVPDTSPPPPPNDDRPKQALPPLAPHPQHTDNNALARPQPRPDVQRSPRVSLYGWSDLGCVEEVG